jgi:hypothetical protein
MDYYLTVYFDKLVNQIDIVIETKLKALNEKILLLSDLSAEIYISKCNYLNLVRDKFINEIECIKQEETKNVKENLSKLNPEIDKFVKFTKESAELFNPIEARDGIVFLKKNYFLIRKLKNKFYENDRLYLLKTDCYLNEKEIESIK